MKITLIFPGCGCTDIPLEDSTIAPGDSTSLRIQFSTGKFMGPVNKRPTIKTDLTGKTPLKIDIHADVLVDGDSAWPVLVATGLAGFGFGSIWTFLADYTDQVGVGAVTPFFVPYVVAAIAVRLFFGHLPDTLGRRAVAVPALLIHATALLLMSSLVTRLQLIGVGALFGVAHGAYYPALQAMVVERSSVTSSRAIAAPIPKLPPVTIAFLPSSVMIAILSASCTGYVNLAPHLPQYSKKAGIPFASHFGHCLAYGPHRNTLDPFGSAARFRMPTKSTLRFSTKAVIPSYGSRLV